MNYKIRRRTLTESRPAQPGRGAAWSRDESGSVAVITALCLVFIIGFLALVVDVGHLYAVRNEVQNASDAAALAGARSLYPFQDYPDTRLIPVTNPPFVDLAVSKGKAAAADNQAGGVTNLATAANDVQTGIWDWDNRSFKPDNIPSFNINAVRAMVRRDTEANQPVASWFAYIIGRDNTPVNAESVAAIGYIKQPGGNVLPIWVPTDIWNTIPVSNNPEFIKANPDPGDRFAWCAPVPESANAQYVKDAIDAAANTPLPAIGDTVNLNNGVLGSAHQEIQKLITNAPATGYFYADGSPITGWITGIMVGDRLNADGSVYHPPAGTPLDVKMNQQGTITGIEPVIVTAVKNSQGGWSITYIKLDPNKNFVWPGAKPGGPASNIYATQPVLVK